MSDKALLIGINEYEKVSSLRGCVNDVHNMERLLTSHLGFKPSSIRKLLDGDAKKKKITEGMNWLFRDVREGDRLVFHFSGHGSYTADFDGDEDDKVDEILCLWDIDGKDFNDQSFLSDDELRQWTQKLPKGVRLLIVLDSCHSGTGTRDLSRSSDAYSPLIVERDTIKRVEQIRAVGRSAGSLVQEIREAYRPESQQAVIARFIQPPPEISGLVHTKPRTRGGMRAIIDVELNHVLLAGCRDNQTSADAWIDGTYNGAFTYHLVKTIEKVGVKADLREIEKNLSAELKKGHFSQEPQFEGPDGAATLFGEKPEGIESPQRESDTTASADFATLSTTVTSGATLTAYERRLALEILHQLVIGITPGSGRFRRTTRAETNRHLVYVHGISKHLPGYSDNWWKALKNHVSDIFGEGDLGVQRHEVRWSDLVNSSRAVDDSRDKLKRAIVETIQERLDEEARQSRSKSRSSSASASQSSLSRGTLDEMGLDDFLIYMTNESKRDQIIECFTSVVRPLLESGNQIDLITHSWGTVVAYEGLRKLEDEGFNATQVRTFFTCGAALSILPVRWRLRRSNQDGRKPSLVRRWINLDASGDPVGGSLVQHFRVDDEFLDLSPGSCQANWIGMYEVNCAHSSYFQEENVSVNKSVFGRFIRG